MDNKYLKLAREARNEDNGEDAKRYYDMVRTEDPENGEAKFFYQYYCLYEGKNGEIANRFANLCKVLVSSVAKVALSEDSDDEKMEVIEAMTDTFTPLTWNLNRYMNKLTVGSGSDRQRVLSNNDIISVCKNGMQGCYNFGDAIEKNFTGNSRAMKSACKVWKEAISLQQKWYAYGRKEDPENYAAKVKKFEPDYEMPKKAGCISFADKKN